MRANEDAAAEQAAPQELLAALPGIAKQPADKQAAEEPKTD